MKFKNLRIFGCYVDDGAPPAGGDPLPATETEKETPPAKTEPDEKTKNALRLHEALNDPAKAPHIVRSMAKTLGLKFQGDEETENAPNKSGKSKSNSAPISEDIKKALGTGYEFMAEPLARAVEAAVNRLVDEKTSDLRSEVSRTSTDRISQEIDTALEKLDGEFDLSEKVIERVQELMGEQAAAPGQKPYNYIKSLVFQASSELDEPVAKKSAARANRIRQNQQDQFGNIRNFKGGGSGKNSSGARGGKMSLNDAAMAAMDEIG